MVLDSPRRLRVLRSFRRSGELALFCNDVPLLSLALCARILITFGGGNLDSLEISCRIARGINGRESCGCLLCQCYKTCFEIFLNESRLCAELDCVSESDRTHYMKRLLESLLFRLRFWEGDEARANVLEATTDKLMSLSLPWPFSDAISGVLSVILALRQGPEARDPTSPSSGTSALLPFSTSAVLNDDMSVQDESGLPGPPALHFLEYTNSLQVSKATHNIFRIPSSEPLRKNGYSDQKPGFGFDTEYLTKQLASSPEVGRDRLSSFLGHHIRKTESLTLTALNPEREALEKANDIKSGTAFFGAVSRKTAGDSVPISVALSIPPLEGTAPLGLIPKHFFAKGECGDKDGIPAETSKRGLNETESIGEGFEEKPTSPSYLQSFISEAKAPRLLSWEAAGESVPRAQKLEERGASVVQTRSMEAYSLLRTGSALGASETGLKTFDATYRATAPSACTVDELVLCRDVLSALQGFPSRTFVVDFTTKPAPTVSVRDEYLSRMRLRSTGVGVLSRLLSEVTDSSQELLSVRAFLTASRAQARGEKESGVVHAALLCAIEMHLRRYSACIVRLHDTCLGCADSSAGPRASLLRIMMSTRALRKHLSFLASLCGVAGQTARVLGSDTPGQPTKRSESKQMCSTKSIWRLPAAEVLGFLYLCAHEASPDFTTARLMSGLFWRAVEPFLVMLQAWVYYGEVVDPHSEFFVEIVESSDAVESEEFWLQRVRLRGEAERAIPAFFSPGEAHLLFRCGWGVRLLRHFCPSHLLLGYGDVGAPSLLLHPGYEAVAGSTEVERSSDKTPRHHGYGGQGVDKDGLDFSTVLESSRKRHEKFLARQRASLQRLAKQRRREARAAEKERLHTDAQQQRARALEKERRQKARREEFKKEETKKAEYASDLARQIAIKLHRPQIQVPIPRSDASNARHRARAARETGLDVEDRMSELVARARHEIVRDFQHQMALLRERERRAKWRVRRYEGYAKRFQLVRGELEEWQREVEAAELRSLSVNSDGTEDDIPFLDVVGGELHSRPQQESQSPSQAQSPQGSALSPGSPPTPSPDTAELRQRPRPSSPPYALDESLQTSPAPQALTLEEPRKLQAQGTEVSSEVISAVRPDADVTQAVRKLVSVERGREGVEGHKVSPKDVSAVLLAEIPAVPAEPVSEPPSSTNSDVAKLNSNDSAAPAPEPIQKDSKYCASSPEPVPTTAGTPSQPEGPQQATNGDRVGGEGGSAEPSETPPAISAEPSVVRPAVAATGGTGPSEPLSEVVEDREAAGGVALTGPKQVESEASSMNSGSESEGPSLRGSMSSSDASNDESSAPAFGSDAPLNLLFRRCVIVPVVEHTRLVERAVLGVFLNDLRLRNHLRALRRYFLMNAGDVMDSFLTSLFNRINGLQDSREMLLYFSPRSLESSFEYCVRTSTSTADSFAQNIYFALSSSLAPSERTPSASGESAAGGATNEAVPASARNLATINEFSLRALDFVEMRYRAQWPLNLVLTSEVLSSYNRFFNFFVRVRRAEWASRQLWCVFQHPTLRGAPSLPLVRKLHAFRARVQHFVSVLQQYFMTQVLQEAWVDFEREVDKAQSVFQFREAHLRYIQVAMSRCLLDDRAKPVLKLLEEILGLILSFQVELSRIHLADAVVQNLDLSHPMFKSVSATMTTFLRASEFLHAFLVKLNKSSYHDHVADLILRMNFNGFLSME